MQSTHPRPAKSARRKFPLALLGVLAVVGVAGIALAATITSSPPRFYLDANPGTQTVAPGQTATYSIALDRQNHHIDPVDLTVTNLPANTEATFHATPIPGSSSSSSLTVETNVEGTTPAGTRTLTITGTGSENTSSDTVALTVLAPTAQNFTLIPRPMAQNVTESDTASYSIGIDRANGFAGAVTMSASGLPSGASAVFSPNPVPGSGTSAGLVVTTNTSVKPGRYPIIVQGLGTVGTTQLTRVTSVALNVEEKKPLRVTSTPATGLFPGGDQPIDVSLTNSHNFEIKAIEVALALDPHSSNPDCNVSDNYFVEQMEASHYPLTLPKDSTRSLSDLGVPESDMPKIKMRNTTFDQGACKGAEISFRQSGTAVKRP